MNDLRAIIDARRSLDPPAFVPGKTLIRATAPTYGYEEIENAIEAAIEFRPAAGRWAMRLEAALARWFFGEHDQPASPAGYARLTNSGSSANLLAIAALTQPELDATRLRPGDEVITIAAGFPTTIAPIVQHGLVPVFVDVQPTDYNADVSQLPLALSPRTRAVFFAHTLGFPFNAQVVREFCTAHGLWFIEDCCDAAGAGWQMWSREGRGPFQKVGTLGDLATLSFYPAHHMTTGEGGAVLTASDLLASLVTSLRDWGRDCYCAPGKDNTCGKRFEQQHGSLPFGYDHKYCTPGDTLIETVEGLIPVATLAQRGGSWHTATLTDAGFAWRSAVAFPTTEREVRCITLRNGMVLRYGWDHPVLTKRGYVKAADLAFSDKVAVAGRPPDRADLDVPDALLTVVGALLADGSYVPRDRYVHSPISWYKTNEACRTAYLRALSTLGATTSIRAQAGGQLYVYVTGTRLHELLASVGYEPVKATEKSIPAKLTQLSARQAAVLLRALWSGDGTCKRKADRLGKSVRIVYGTRSAKLAAGVQRLLFQQGVLATVTTQRLVYRGDVRPYHLVTVVGRDSKRKMLDLLDGAPRVGDDVEALRVLLAVTPERVPGERNPKLDGEVWWVGVKWNTVEPMQPVFDVTVDSPEHNYVAAGVVTHNCYSHLGYNLKLTDMQAAIGCAQVERLNASVEARRENWRALRIGLADLGEHLAFVEASPHAHPSPFGFLVTARDGAKRRDQLVRALESHRIATRPLFAGNIIRQPAMRGVAFRTAGALRETDRAMRGAFWIGVGPWLTREMREYVINVFHEVLR